MKSTKLLKEIQKDLLSAYDKINTLINLFPLEHEYAIEIQWQLFHAINDFKRKIDDSEKNK